MQQSRENYIVAVEKEINNENGKEVKERSRRKIEKENEVNENEKR